jgi:hypothetical protein
VNLTVRLAQDRLVSVETRANERLFWIYEWHQTVNQCSCPDHLPRAVWPLTVASDEDMIDSVVLRLEPVISIALEFIPDAGDDLSWLPTALHVKPNLAFKSINATLL